MIFPGFPGVPSFFQVEWEPWSLDYMIEHKVLLTRNNCYGGVRNLALSLVSGC